MGDLYLEELVRRKKTFKDIALTVLLLFLAFWTWFCSFLTSGSLVYLIPAFVITGLDFFLLPRLNVEWEYTYLNGDLDIDKIFNRSKRKRVGSYEIKSAEIIAPASSHRLDYYNNNHNALKVRDFTSLFAENKKRIYVMIIETDKGKQKVLFEPSEAMLKDMMRRSPRTVFMD